MRTMMRLGLGAAAVAAGTAVQWFRALVERGRAVRPQDDGLASALDRALTVELPSAVGAGIGTALDGGLRAAEHVRNVALATGSELGGLAEAMFERAGVPRRSELDALVRRLDVAAAALDRIAADPLAPPGREPRDRTRRRERAGVQSGSRSGGTSGRSRRR